MTSWGWAKWSAAVLVAVVLSGCSVYMAASSDGKKDLSVLRPGTDRDTVIAELGAPITSDWIETAALSPDAEPKRERVDIFKFLLERSSASNSGRAVAYGAAAVLTLGLSELVTTPLEAGVGDAGERRCRIVYDEDDRVSRIESFDDGEWIPVGEDVAAAAERDDEAQAEAEAEADKRLLGE